MHITIKYWNILEIIRSQTIRDISKGFFNDREEKGVKNCLNCFNNAIKKKKTN